MRKRLRTFWWQLTYMDNILLILQGIILLFLGPALVALYASAGFSRFITYVLALVTIGVLYGIYFLVKYLRNRNT